MSVPLPPVPRVPDDAPDPTSDEAYPHEWEVAAVITVTPKEASLAAKRRYHVIRVPEKDIADLAAKPVRSGRPRTIGLRVGADDVYCRRCRTTWEVGEGTICAARLKDEREKAHLIGGHQEERKKRKAVVPPQGVKVIPGPPISRIGLDAFLDGHC